MLAAAVVFWHDLSVAFRVSANILDIPTHKLAAFIFSNQYKNAIIKRVFENA